MRFLWLQVPAMLLTIWPAMGQLAFASPLDDTEALEQILQSQGEGDAPIAANPAVAAADLPGLDVPEEIRQLEEFQQAQQAFLAGDLAECQEKLRQAHASHPQVSPPQLMLARFLLASGKIPPGRRMLEQFAATHGDHVEVHLLFGQLALHEGRITDAAVQFKSASNGQPPASWSDDQRRWLQEGCLWGMATVEQRRGNWSTASKLLGQLVETRPRDASLRDRWGQVLFHDGKQQQALDQFDNAHRQDERISVPQISMAAMCVQAGQFDQAEQWFAQALEQHPRDPNVHFERSVALMHQNRADEAQQHAELAAQFGLDSPLLLLHRGSIALQQEKHGQAEQWFESFLAKIPGHGAASSNLALALVHSREEAKRQRALQLALHAAQNEPRSVDAAAVLGWVLFQLGRMDEAEQQLRQALGRSASNRTAMYFLARLLVEQGKRDQGMRLAQLLRGRLDQPGQFVLRPEARRWLAGVLDE